MYLLSEMAILGIHVRFQGVSYPMILDASRPSTKRILIYGDFESKSTNHQPTAWRIIPVSKWLVTPIYKPSCRPIWKGNVAILRGLTNHGYPPLASPGMILQVCVFSLFAFKLPINKPVVCMARVNGLVTISCAWRSVVPAKSSRPLAACLRPSSVSALSGFMINALSTWVESHSWQVIYVGIREFQLLNKNGEGIW